MRVEERVKYGIVPRLRSATVKGIDDYWDCGGGEGIYLYFCGIILK